MRSPLARSLNDAADLLAKVAVFLVFGPLIIGIGIVVVVSYLFWEGLVFVAEALFEGRGSWLKHDAP